MYYVEAYIILSGFIVSYLIGSMPTSVWIGKKLYNIDIREHGSGNAGATNTLRVLGNKAGIIVLLIDFLKGFGVIAFASIFKPFIQSPEYYVIYQLLLGFLAVFGHMFPVFANFRGGKGVATLAGIVLAIYPKVFLICLVIFALVFISTRYVSLSSIVTATVFPVLVIFVFNTELLSKIVFAILASSILIITHRKNIQRLINGTERKILFK